jgi:flagellar hook-associated protein 1 FlgK
MALSTFFGLNTSYSGLKAQQIALDTVGHNISNADTLGYTRQVTDMSATYPMKIQAGYVGTGVEVYDIRRIRDTLLDMQYRKEVQSVGEWDTKNSLYGTLESIFNEPAGEEDSNLRTVMDKYWESWNELYKYPSSTEIRSVVVQDGVTLTSVLNLMDGQLKELQRQINESIELMVPEINNMAYRIRDLNKQIALMEATGRRANDLRDKRDLLIDQLSEIMNVDVVEDKDGAVSITMGGNLIVSKNVVVEMRFDNNIAFPEQAKLYWQLPDTGQKLGAVSLKSGILAGYVEIRDRVVGGSEGLIAKLDQFTERMAYEVNELHRQGQTLEGTTGVAFFTKIDASQPFAAGNIRVNPNLEKNVNLVAAGADLPGVNGDGGNALAIAQLKNKNVLNSALPRLDKGVMGQALGTEAKQNGLTLQAGVGMQLWGAQDLSGGLNFDLLPNQLEMTVNNRSRTIQLSGDYTMYAVDQPKSISDPNYLTDPSQLTSINIVFVGAAGGPRNAVFDGVNTITVNYDTTSNSGTGDTIADLVRDWENIAADQVKRLVSLSDISGASSALLSSLTSTVSLTLGTDGKREGTVDDGMGSAIKFKENPSALELLAKHVEDRLMAAFFPDEYDAYQKGTSEPLIAVKIGDSPDGSGAQVLIIEDMAQQNSTSSISIGSVYVNGVATGGAAAVLFGNNWDLSPNAVGASVQTSGGKDSNLEMTLELDGIISSDVNPTVSNPGVTKSYQLKIDLSSYLADPGTRGEYTFGLRDIAFLLETEINSHFGDGEKVMVTLEGPRGDQIVIRSMNTGDERQVAEISGALAALTGLETGYAATMDSYYLSIVANLGVKGQEAAQLSEHHTMMLNQLENQRLSVSGVNLDEEMVHMIQFQQAYNASARMITVMDEMLDIIVNRLGTVGR